SATPSIRPSSSATRASSLPDSKIQERSRSASVSSGGGSFSNRASSRSSSTILGPSSRRARRTTGCEPFISRRLSWLDGGDLREVHVPDERHGLLPRDVRALSEDQAGGGHDDGDERRRASGRPVRHDEGLAA